MQFHQVKLVVLLEFCCISISLSVTTLSSFSKDTYTTTTDLNATDTNYTTTDAYENGFSSIIEKSENLLTNSSKLKVDDMDDKSNQSDNETTLSLTMTTKYPEEISTSLSSTNDILNRKSTKSKSTTKSKINHEETTYNKLSKKTSTTPGRLQPKVQTKDIDEKKIFPNVNHVRGSNLSNIIIVKPEMVVIEVPLSIEIEVIDTKYTLEQNTNSNLIDKSLNHLSVFQFEHSARSRNIKHPSKGENFIETLRQSSPISSPPQKYKTASVVKNMSLYTKSYTNYKSTESSKSKTNTIAPITNKIFKLIEKLKFSQKIEISNTLKSSTTTHKIYEEKATSELFHQLTTPNPKVRQKSPWKTRDPQRIVTDFEKVCNLTVDRGYGSDSYSSWYFNSKNGKCEWFSYHGEGGNGNRFYYRANCEHSCIDRHKDLCFRKDIVNCMENWLRCKMESDVNCARNAKLKRKDEELFCPPKQPICSYAKFRFRKSPTYLTHRSLIPQDCFLPRDSGHCLKDSDSTLVYHYESKINDCLAFLYSNCGGNLNRFLSKNDCMNRCAI